MDMLTAFKESWLAYLAAAIAMSFALAYYYMKKSFRYFEDRNLPYIKPKNFLGSDPDGVLLRISIGESWDRIYKQLGDNKVGGFFQAFIPFLMVKDPDYVNRVMISSFDHFVDRPLLVDEKTNPLEAHLFLLRGNKWRFLRNKLSPIFTSGKLRWMFTEMDKCGDSFIKCIDPVADGSDIDFLDHLARFTTDVIGSCAFGLEGESLTNPDSFLRKMGKTIFEPKLTNWTQISFLIRMSFPRLVYNLKLRTFPKAFEDTFCSMVFQVLNERRKTGAQRRDFVQLLLLLKEKGLVEIDTNDQEENETEADDKNATEKLEITDLLLAAQSFVFYLAGFETTSRTLHYLLYLFSEYPEIQERARREVLDIKDKYGQYSYDALKDMKFVDNCISETLRLFPPIPFLFRECIKDFPFPNGNVIAKGSSVAIPVFSLQRDPNYFPDPLKFNPDRFEEQPIRGTYMPFGDGPRICIGKRFALVEIKVVIARLLERYRFERSTLNEKTYQEIEFTGFSSILAPTKGLHMKIHKLQP